jgi:hypothetical protein
MFQLTDFSVKERLLKYEILSKYFGVWGLLLDFVMLLFMQDINALQVDFAAQVKCGVVIKNKPGSYASLVQILFYSK